MMTHDERLKLIMRPFEIQGPPSGGRDHSGVHVTPHPWTTGDDEMPAYGWRIYSREERRAQSTRKSR